jgi:hypothetical protein
MTTLSDQIQYHTQLVLDGFYNLDDALVGLENWLNDNLAALTPEVRAAFRASLDAESTDDDRSLVDSVIKLHVTRLLHRTDAESDPPFAGGGETTTAYSQARDAFVEALLENENGIRESRIDIAIANAQHLLGNTDANRRWLDSALDRLPALAAPDLIDLARDVPDMPVPRLNWFKRVGLRVLGINLGRLAARNRDSLAAMARMQFDQVILLAHLLGTSYETIRERQRANRAFRISAYLIVRYGGLTLDEPEQTLAIAESLARPEPEAAQLLAQQVLAAIDDESDDLHARAEAILNGAST